MLKSQMVENQMTGFNASMQWQSLEYWVVTLAS